MSERRYCSQLNLSEAMAGTADVVDVWLMLEYRGVFRKKAVTENALAPETSAWLKQSVASLIDAGLKTRVQFIRQPEVDKEGVTCFIATNRQTWVIEQPNYQSLPGIDILQVIADNSAYQKTDKAQYFVCTNGQRDLCCAKFGLPVYLELRQRFPDRVWQTSHVGGHRYAPNVLVLPQGILYGRVHPEVIDEFCEIIESGRVAFAQLRGRSCYKKYVQAAEAFVGVEGLRLLHVLETSKGFSVQFAGSEKKYIVEVVKSSDYPIQASCSAEDKVVTCWINDTANSASG